jgi:hypothetical protein
MLATGLALFAEHQRIDAVKERQEAVKQGQEAVKQGQEAVKQGQEAVKQGQEALRRAPGMARVFVGLERAPIDQAYSAGRFAEARRLQDVFAARVEADETKREGKPGEATASELNEVIWYALLAREFTRALAAADHAHELSPDDLEIESNRAHFTPESGHVQCNIPCPLWAKSGHPQRKPYGVSLPCCAWSAIATTRVCVTPP